jgi:hypothetical protein
MTAEPDWRLRRWPTARETDYADSFGVETVTPIVDHRCLSSAMVIVIRATNQQAGAWLYLALRNR